MAVGKKPKKKATKAASTRNVKEPSKPKARNTLVHTRILKVKSPKKKEKERSKPKASTQARTRISKVSPLKKENALDDLKRGIAVKTLKTKYTSSVISDALNNYLIEADKNIEKKKTQLKDLEEKIKEQTTKSETTSTSLQVVKEKHSDKESDLAKIKAEITKRTLELEKLDNEFFEKEKELQKTKAELRKYTRTSYLPSQFSLKSKFFDLGFIKGNAAPAILLIVLIGASVGYLGSYRMSSVRISELEGSVKQYSNSLSDINAKYNVLLANYTKSTNDFEILTEQFDDLLAHYNLINGPKSAFVALNDLNITLTTSRSVYNYTDPLNVILKIKKLDNTPFNGIVTFKLSMGENTNIGYQRNINGEIDFNMPTPAFQWGPGIYTLQLQSISDPGNFVIAMGKTLSNSTITIEAK